MVKELVIFQKGYMKYLTDNYRLNYTEDIPIEDITRFVPDVISFLGAPEKLISFPQIGYFDIPGPNGEHQDDRYAVETEGRLFRGCQETTSDGDQ